MRTLRKTKRCLNCDLPLTDVYDYCPTCGQQNDDKNVSFGELMHDFIENIISFDTRLTHSIIPFFFKPGYLTNKYNDGKRRKYANPIRLYFIISLVFFFVLKMVVSELVRQTSSEINEGNLDEEISKELINDSDSVKVSFAGQEEEFIIASDSTNSSFNITSSDSTNADLWPLSNDQWKVFWDLKDNEKLTEQQLFDTLQVTNRAAFTQHVVHQIIRVYKRDKEYLSGFIVQNLSIMMILMIPIFGAILKLLYIRRKRLFIHHVIHSLHIHTYAYLIYGLAMYIISKWISDEDAQSWITFVSIIVVSTYSYISFMTVYKQKWFKTLIKFWLVGAFYVNALWMAFLVELFVSFLIF